MVDVIVRTEGGVSLRSVTAQQNGCSLVLLAERSDLAESSTEMSPIELRQVLASVLGEGACTAALDKVLLENARLLELEGSILKKAEMLRNNFWDASDDVGAAGAIHGGITSLWMDMEALAAQRDQLQEKLVAG
ncbi:hypothetical protein [Pseudomonas sp.]|uniref:hypothetical protein n=1 Tax=Pseudomonas sp. TaxID=306 RepID=UPI00260FE2BC|nr:hypothetical protein [Pseudomonas sp.]